MAKFDWIEINAVKHGNKCKENHWREVTSNCESYALLLDSNLFDPVYFDLRFKQIVASGLNNFSQNDERKSAPYLSWARSRQSNNWRCDSAIGIETEDTYAQIKHSSIITFNTRLCIRGKTEIITKMTHKESGETRKSTEKNVLINPCKNCKQSPRTRISTCKEAAPSVERRKLLETRLWKKKLYTMVINH